MKATGVRWFFVVPFAAASVAAGQAPVRDLTLVAPAAPGGGWDQTARVMQQVLRDAGLATNVQVVNAAGAAGTIGLARFVTSERGRDNALLVTGLVMVSGIVTNNSPVTLADVTPIARLSGEYEVIVVPASSPFRTLSDLVAAFRANPRSVSWGGGSAGGTDEILVRLLAADVGVPLDGVNYIAYSGGGQALAAVLGAHVSAAVSGLGEFGSQIESGALRALSISAPERVPGITIPTMREQGVDVELLNWRGVVAPPGITRAERARLVAMIRGMTESDAWKETLARNGWADIYMEGDAYARFVTDETARVGPLVAAGSRRDGADWVQRLVLLGFAASIIAAVAVSRRGAGALAASAPEATPARNTRAVATLAIAIAVDVALMPLVGFAVASAVMFALAARAFGSRSVVRDAIIGIVLASAVHVVFARGLGVHLPMGAFFG